VACEGERSDDAEALAKREGVGQVRPARLDVPRPLVPKEKWYTAPAVQCNDLHPTKPDSR
jgi:hypothetical protein